MLNKSSVGFAVAISALGLSATCRADSWDVVSPDGSTVRTTVSGTGEQRTVTTVRTAPLVQESRSSFVLSGPSVPGFGAQRYRSYDRGCREPDYDDGAFYSYPTYPSNFQLPGPGNTGAWITSLPSPGLGYGPYPTYSNPYGVGDPYYVYPAANLPVTGYQSYGYPTYQGINPGSNVYTVPARSYQYGYATNVQPYGYGYGCEQPRNGVTITYGNSRSGTFSYSR